MELTIDQTVVLATGNGEMNTATGYAHDIRAIQPVSAHTWTSGANLAQWGGFKRNDYVCRSIHETLWESEIGFTQSRSEAYAQRFDY